MAVVVVVVELVVVVMGAAVVVVVGVVVVVVTSSVSPPLPPLVVSPLVDVSEADGARVVVVGSLLSLAWRLWRTAASTLVASASKHTASKRVTTQKSRPIVWRPPLVACF